MKIELRKNCAYALLVPTSMGVRITPANGQPAHCSGTFFMQATSAETNVASVAAYLGLPVKVLTTFVKDSPIARFIKDNLASRHMAYEGKEYARYIGIALRSAVESDHWLEVLKNLFETFSEQAIKVSSMNEEVIKMLIKLKQAIEDKRKKG